MAVWPVPIVIKRMTSVLPLNSVNRKAGKDNKGTAMFATLGVNHASLDYCTMCAGVKCKKPVPFRN